MNWLSQCGRASSAELGVGSVRGPSELCQTVGQCGHTPLISQPNISTLQVRLQTQSATNPLYRGTWDCVGQTVRKEGLRALYKGKKCEVTTSRISIILSTSQHHHQNSLWCFNVSHHVTNIMSWEQDNYKQYITFHITQICPPTSFSLQSVHESNMKRKKHFDFSQFSKLK